MKIAVVGAGYVGCVSAACLARRGHAVVAVEMDGSKVEQINRGESPVFEPGLEELVAQLVRAGSLSAVAPSVEAFANVEIAIVCVATPSMPDGSVDVRPMRRVIELLAEASATRAAPLVVVIRSTIAPPHLRGVLAQVGAGKLAGLRFVANPEFLRETTAIDDFEHPPFIILGGDDAAAMDVAARLYEGIDAPLHRLDLETAILVKYASNAYHGLKIAFANEIATVAEGMGADPIKVMSVFVEDRILNVSKAYLRPGFAFGGSCLPKDIRALLAIGVAQHAALPVLQGALDSNRLRIARAAETIAASGARKLALIGLSFKRGTDDMRESPYLLLAEQLAGRGITLGIYDPDIAAEHLLGRNLGYIRGHLPEFSNLFVRTLDEALAGAEGVILCKRMIDAEALATLAERVPIWDVEYLARIAGVPARSPFAPPTSTSGGASR